MLIHCDIPMHFHILDTKWIFDVEKIIPWKACMVSLKFTYVAISITKKCMKLMCKAFDLHCIKATTGDLEAHPHQAYKHFAIGAMRSQTNGNVLWWSP